MHLALFFFEEFPVLLQLLATVLVISISMWMTQAIILDILNCFNLEQHITLPTHKNSHTLDLIITRNDKYLIPNIDVRNPLISDHFACYCSM